MIPECNPSANLYISGVGVTVPLLLIVGEGDGMVQVCAMLSATEDIERDVTIRLATGDVTGNQHGVL